MNVLVTFIIHLKLFLLMVLLLFLLYWNFRLVINIWMKNFSVNIIKIRAEIFHVLTLVKRLIIVRNEILRNWKLWLRHTLSLILKYRFWILHWFLSKHVAISFWTRAKLFYFIEFHKWWMSLHTHMFDIFAHNAEIFVLEVRNVCCIISRDFWIIYTRHRCPIHVNYLISTLNSCWFFV